MQIRDGWVFEDKVTGLTLAVIAGKALNRLSITREPGGHGRDFFFTKAGEFDGTGSFLCAASREPEPVAEE